MPASLDIRANAENPHLGSRLDGWKEIATYLSRGERTVKRWEVERRLPIHRLPGGGRSSVYAFSTELDEWLQSSQPEVPDDRSSMDPPPEGQSSADRAATESANAPQLADPTASPTSLQVIQSPEPERVPPPSAVGRPFRTLWVFTSTVVLVLALTAASWRLPAVRSFVARFSSSRSTHSALQQPASPATKVSEEEKKKARELYLQGRYEWNQRTPDALDRALDAFTQAIVHDPGSAEAYVGLADTYDLLREYSRMPDSAAYARSTAAARKAVQLDDSLAEAHRALAFAEMYGSWDFRDGEKEFRRAIELNPYDPVAHRWYANAISVPGRFQESFREIERAQELDPTSHSTLADKGMMLFNAGRSGEAVDLLKQVERSAPDFQSPHKYLMRIAFFTENYSAYLAEGRTLAQLSGDPVLSQEIQQAQAGYARAGKDGLLRKLYAKQREDYAAGKLGATILAQTCVQLGKKREAIQLLEEGYAHHEQYVISASLSDPILLKLKDEPGYQALIRKIDFPLS